MIDDVKHIFMCLFAMWISFLLKCLFMSFAHFLIASFGFLLLGFENSLCILDTSTLLDLSFANTSPSL